MNGGDDVTPDAVPAAAPDGSTSPPDPESVAPPLPTDAAGWRAFLLSVPTHELLRVVQEDKARAARLLTGFRPSPDILRRPVVVDRLIQEALKQPKFGEALGELARRPVASRAPKVTLPHSDPPPTPAKGEEASSALRATLARQRSALRDKDARIHELETAVSALTRERDLARAEVETAVAARRTAEADAERQRRQRERETRRQAAGGLSKSPQVTETRFRRSAIISPPYPAPDAAHPFDEAVTRLLTRGKYNVVAELCREALMTEAAAGSAVRRGQVHAFYAAAFYGEGNAVAGEEQDRKAAMELLDGGRLIAAAESMARLLTQASALKTADVALLRRLLLLAEKEAQGEGVRDVFIRMRIGAPQAYRRMQAALMAGGGRKAPRLLNTAKESVLVIGPDERIALPTASPMAAIVTPRRIAQAVDAGEEEFIARVREGVEALRERDARGASLADALLEAVAAVDSIAVTPLIRPTTPIIVDASNVARHTPDPLALEPPPRVANLRQMRDELLRRGFFPVLMIADASLHFFVDDRAAYQLLVDRNIVRETLPGTSADEVLIREATARHAPLVTNDRLSDWGEAVHHIERYGFLFLSNRVALTPA
jgi:hypothetical protein